ncbi:hypothetical protein TNCV_2122151 [Trichonephila clavipes]|nr:hypothetical protein TNCV_2122151 [Trichonephila clavipes]
MKISCSCLEWGHNRHFLHHTIFDVSYPKGSSEKLLSAVVVTGRVKTSRHAVIISGQLEARYTTTNRRAPLAVRPLEALAPGQDDGNPPGTDVTSLPQQPITEIPLANSGKEQRPQEF